MPLGGSLSDKPRLTEALQTRLSAVADRILSSTDPLLFEAMPAEATELPGIQALSAKYTAKPALELDYPVGMIPFPWVVRPVIRPLGIGDLKVVKQSLHRYVAGEVAHIENVLEGENKERKHRRLDRTEETFTIEIETVEETERDTQTTDRFELKKETEKTITEDMSVDAGITVSASYGPVELGAYGELRLQPVLHRDDEEQPELRARRRRPLGHEDPEAGPRGARHQDDQGDRGDRTCTASTTARPATGTSPASTAGSTSTTRRRCTTTASA